MLPVVAVVGEHGVGKTTLLEGLIRVLRARGFRVGVVKSTKEPRGETDRPGTDTFRLREAGAEPVALWAGEEVVIYSRAFPSRKEDFPYLLFREFTACHLVLAEGFKGLSYLPKIEVLRKGVSRRYLFREIEGVVALAADFHPSAELPVFRLDEWEALADFLEERFLRVYFPRVQVYVDGKPVALNRYVRRALSGLLYGFLKSLRGVPRHPLRVEIRLEDQ
ncbi:MAG TPA: molybdopterin-guanine dinucleotide biosynthesis protein B [Thermosulfurimonas dismutans]|uniref:Molybdopterin-guanine dinucleotide biosynthesis protein B n=1 Tax=Thermosulfurimonas dismutans TaxID=999894 RepID=A0A7C3GVQ2_9BACT|nr:molybdopterin-guanine dinucleotide biosynthesis protein B [Thermosulfurimonas dismutans]